LDTEQFRLDLRGFEDDEEGMPFPDTHNHSTEVTVAGITYARVIEIINGYTIEFEDGQYSVRLVGSNNNFFDVENGILTQNQVQVIPGNAAGLIVRELGTSGLTPTESAALLNIDSNVDTLQTDVATIQVDISSMESAITIIETEVARALGLMQENIQIDQQQYTDYQGQSLLTSARIRIYNKPVSQATDQDVIAIYAVSASWSGQQQTGYICERTDTTTTTTTTTTSTTSTTTT
jgi:hypothetical protein